jgi:ABC-type bacteriocin/lantibiotic exporter with double-glycine peptidase domain
MKKLFMRFKNRLGITFGLLFLESIAELLFPLVIGFAIDDFLDKRYDGLIQLLVLGFFTILIGAVRRLIDSRFYGYIFVQLGTELANSQSRLSPSRKSAQLSLLNEIVEFLENSMPTLFTYVVGLVGTLFILFSLNLPVAVGCLVASFVTLGVYIATSSKTTRLNRGWNDEFEKRVDIVTKNNDAETVQHLHRFMRWNIRLSDLETVNYSIAWLTAIGLLAYTVITTSIDTVEYGTIFSVVMYVYQFIEGYTEVPLHYQEWLRLREISSRINMSLAENKK